MLTTDTIAQLRQLLGPANVLTEREDLIPYSFDGTAAISRLPGCVLELPEASWCCGSAGVYNLTQPEMAGQLLERKIKHIKSTGATTVATANPGCLLQLINGAKQHGLDLRVVHPITLLAEAYRAERD